MLETLRARTIGRSGRKARPAERFRRLNVRGPLFVGYLIIIFFFFGGLGWAGVNTGVISSRRPQNLPY